MRVQPGMASRSQPSVVHSTGTTVGWRTRTSSRFPETALLLPSSLDDTPRPPSRLRSSPATRLVRPVAKGPVGQGTFDRSHGPRQVGGSADAGGRAMQTTVRVKAPSALLVSEDFVRRNRWAAWLKTAGYDTATCAGPHTVRGCPRLKGERCPLREWADLAVVDAPRGAGFEQYVGWVEKPCTTLPDDGRTVFAYHGRTARARPRLVRLNLASVHHPSRLCGACCSSWPACCTGKGPRRCTTTGRARAPPGLAARVGAAANRLLASHGAIRSTCGAARLRYTPSDVHKRTATDHGEPR